MANLLNSIQNLKPYYVSNSTNTQIDWMKRNKTARILLIIAIIFAIPLLLMKGCQSLAKEIYWSMDCDQFNIDHIDRSALYPQVGLASGNICAGLPLLKQGISREAHTMPERSAVDFSVLTNLGRMGAMQLLVFVSHSVYAVVYITRLFTVREQEKKHQGDKGCNL